MNEMEAILLLVLIFLLKIIFLIIAAVLLNSILTNMHNIVSQ